MVQLMPHQEEVLGRLDNSKILWGGVGSGKSYVALSYYENNEVGNDLYVITTAKKRDSLEWERDAARFGIGVDPDTTMAGVLHIDSWNNISKFEDVEGAFFIFDEQRVVGNGAWVKSFLKIAKKNSWIILSATPGDTWMDYVPVFIANGYYKNPTEFKREHVIYRPFTRYPQIDRFIGVSKLERLRDEVLVEMPYISAAIRHHEDCRVFYDPELLKQASVQRWNPFENRPLRDVSELFAVCRKIVYTDRSRLETLRELLDRHPKIIVFYNFNYELDILRELNDSWSDLVTVAEWNGHKKEQIPQTDSWVYLVQYTSGSEAWNCIETDTMVFYSLPYSFRKWEQSQGRIDRANTRFKHLHYFSFFADSFIEKGVRASLRSKKEFNETKYAREHGLYFDPLEVQNEEYDV